MWGGVSWGEQSAVGSAHCWVGDGVRLRNEDDRTAYLSR